jgi:competence protein ComEC
MVSYRPHRLWTAILLLIFVAGTLFASVATEGDTLIVHFIDVGQGDATLFAGPDFTILVDAGRHDRNDVVPYLQSVGVESIDLLVGTHPHADHIGQFPEVLNAFPVNEVWMSGDSHTTRTFERALDAILASDTGYHEPRAGEVYAV